MRLHGLASVADPAGWTFAVQQGFTIVSKDEDFHHLSFLRGAPPKVIGIGLGNCSTSAVEILLRSSFGVIQNFLFDPKAAFLMLP